MELITLDIPWGANCEWIEHVPHTMRQIIANEIGIGARFGQSMI